MPLPALSVNKDRASIAEVKTEPLGAFDMADIVALLSSPVDDASIASS